MNYKAYLELTARHGAPHAEGVMAMLYAQCAQHLTPEQLAYIERSGALAMLDLDTVTTDLTNMASMVDALNNPLADPDQARAVLGNAANQLRVIRSSLELAYLARQQPRQRAVNAAQPRINATTE